jgi:anthranilate 1,2-dioxygenase small subunit
MTAPASLFDEAALRAWLADYAAGLDADDLEAWPDYFLDDGIYRVVSRENEMLGLPAPLVYYYSRGMMQDRVTALREALTYEFVFTRHIVSAARLCETVDGDVSSRSTFAIYQSTEEGLSRLFCVGEYQDVIAMTAAGPKFRERRVIVDTFGIQNLIAVPL